MGYLNSYAYFLPVHALYQIVSIKLCHNGRREQASRTEIYPKPRERGFDFSTNQYGGVL